MTKLRRAAALVASGLLLHLNLLSVVRECASSPAAAALAEHSQHGDHAPQPAPSQSQSQSQCCDAMTTCVPSLEQGCERSVSVVAISSDVISMPIDALHAVSRRAPDPPPPRAQA